MSRDRRPLDHPWGWTASQGDPNDELTATPLAVVQYGGAFSVVTGHRLPLLPGAALIDRDIAEVRQDVHPADYIAAVALLQPDSPLLPEERAS